LLLHIPYKKIIISDVGKGLAVTQEATELEPEQLEMSEAPAPEEAGL